MWTSKTPYVAGTTTPASAATTWADHLCELTARFLILDVIAPVAIGAGLEGIKQGKVLGGWICGLAGLLQLLGAMSCLGIMALLALQSWNQTE